MIFTCRVRCHSGHGARVNRAVQFVESQSGLVTIRMSVRILGIGVGDLHSLQINLDSQECEAHHWTHTFVQSHCHPQFSAYLQDDSQVMSTSFLSQLPRAIKSSRSPPLRCVRAHSGASAMAVKILGADLRPNGSMLSTKILLFHLIPSSKRSCRCTGTS